MAKKVIGFIKLQIPAGQANPAPPVGPALGQQGVNIMDFCKAFNAKTQDKMGDIIPVEITVYADRSFTFVTKTPPASRLILKSASLKKGSGEPNKDCIHDIAISLLLLIPHWAPTNPSPSIAIACNSTVPVSWFGWLFRIILGANAP